MHLFKKLIILLAIGTLLHFQLPHMVSADAKPAKVTPNKPQFAGTAQEYLPGAKSSGAKSGGGKPLNKRHIWIAAGAVAALALAIGAAGGGGGGGGGGNPPEDQEPGGVEVEW
jgi:hypothetical protein